MSDATHLTSAVLLVPPPEVAAFADLIREHYLAQSGDWFRVPAHFTLMYPFVSPGTVEAGPNPTVLEATLARLAEVCAEAEPFPLVVDHYGTFPGVLYAAPQDPAPIIALHQRILAAFPDYPPYGGQYAAFTPHMTLARFDDDSAMRAYQPPPIPPLRFTATALHLYYGVSHLPQPWTAAARIPLGRGQPAAS